MRIKDLANTATEADLVSGKYLALDGSAGSEKLPSDVFPTISAKFSNKASGYHTDTIDGNGTTSVTSTAFPAVNGKRYVLTPSSTTWAVTSLSDSMAKLIVQKVYADGTTANIRSFQKNTTVPATIEFTLNDQNAIYLRLFFRGDVGEQVSFVWSAPFDVEQVGGEIENSFIYPLDELNGNGMTPITGQEVVAKNGSFYSIKLSSTTWAVTSLSDSSAKLAIQKVYADGTTANVVAWLKNGTIPSDIITFTLNDANALYLRVFFRGDVGEQVSFSWDFSRIAVSNKVEINNTVENLSTKVHTLVGAGTTGKNGTSVPAINGKTYTIIPSCTDWKCTSLSSSYVKFAVQKIYKNNSSSNVVSYAATSILPPVITFTLNDDKAVFLRVFFRGDVGEEVSFTWDSEIENVVETERQFFTEVKAINHRGYNSIAPENTIPAFKLSKRKGFNYVETDINTTSDGYFVCIHDSTVDRTSDGSGNVADMTLSQLKALDFGSWKSSVYAGTKIPTLEEFLVCCRNLGLKAYIELKGVTTSGAVSVCKIINNYGMAGNVTLESFSLPLLEAVQTAFSGKFRLGYLLNTVSSSDVSDIVNLDGGNGNVFCLAYYQQDTATVRGYLSAEGVPFEVWGVDNENHIKLSMSDMVSGYICDTVNAGVALYSKEMARILQ